MTDGITMEQCDTIFGHARAHCRVSLVVKDLCGNVDVRTLHGQSDCIYSTKFSTKCIHHLISVVIIEQFCNSAAYLSFEPKYVVACYMYVRYTSSV